MAGELVPRNSNSDASRQFRLRLDYWDKLFDVASNEQIENLIKPAINELDGLWAERGIYGMDCLISGEGMWTETVGPDDLTEEDQANIQLILPHENQYTVARFGRVVNRRCFSQGISFVKFPDVEKPRLSYQFLFPEVFNGFGTLIDYNVRHHVQIKLGTLSLLTVQDVELGLTPLANRFEPLAAHN
jgi:hypothetical protein